MSRTLRSQWVLDRLTLHGHLTMDRETARAYALRFKTRDLKALRSRVALLERKGLVRMEGKTVYPQRGGR